jgi:DHA2 family multidrug resistance protein-like MFS transporter
MIDTAAAEGSVGPRATRREWIGLAVIALPCLLASMDLTVLYLAVPALSRDLEPSSTQLLWITDIYGFLIAGFLVTMGTLGDRIGRRRLLLIGATFFGLASVLAAFSSTPEMLIATRALLGVAGATLAPSTLSLIRNMFLDPQERTAAIGIWATSFSVGAALGPLFGGFLLEAFWWGAVFLLAVPVMFLLLVLGPRLLPEFRDPNAGRLDLVSALLSLLAVLSVIYGLKQIAAYGVGPGAFLAIAGGVAFGIVFIRRQRGLADPLIELRLFARRSFSIPLAMNTLSIFVAFGVFLFIAQYLQLVLGLSPLLAGFWTIPSSCGFILGSMAAPGLARRWRPADVMAGSLVVSAAGLVLLTQMDGSTGLAIVVIGSVLHAVGISPVVTLGTDLIVGNAPAERAGAASAISETGAELGGALGIAVLGSVGTAVYRRAFSAESLGGVPAEAVEAARGTLGGALTVAQTIPPGPGDQLVAVAREAFIHALATSAAIGAGVVLALAVLSVLMLRPGGAPHAVAARNRTSS